MTVAVRYFSRSGNTKKVAEAIASAAGVEAKTVDSPLEEKTDILFLGSAVYAAGVDPAISDFIKNNSAKIGKIANFSTAAVIPSTYRQVKKIAEENNVCILEKEFHCKGKFAVMHTSHPDENDLNSAKDFAKAVISAGV